MSIADFLDEMALHQTQQARYEQTRSQFAEDCMSDIVACLRANGFTRSLIETSEDDRKQIAERFFHLSSNIYDTLEHFMRHYAKTERISFQIVPEESWDRDNIDVRSLIGTLSEYTRQTENQFNVDQRSISKEYYMLSIRTKDCYKGIHKILKKKSFEYFPAIVNLPALGLRELDFILFEETHGFME